MTMILFTTTAEIINSNCRLTGAGSFFTKLQFYIRNLTMGPPIVYHSLEAVMDVLKTYESTKPAAVKSLLEMHEQLQKDVAELKSDQKRHLFVVMEGLDGTGKTTVSRVLAKNVGADTFCTPPPCLHSIRSLFDEDALLRTAYYAMGNYIAALELHKKLLTKPVILDRYWHSTTAYAIAQAINDNPAENVLPPKGDKIYQWPSDLLKPDIVLLMSVNEQERLRRHSLRHIATTNQEHLLKSDQEFRQNVLTAYGNMENPDIVVVDGNNSKKVVAQRLLEKIKGFL